MVRGRRGSDLKMMTVQLVKTVLEVSRTKKTIRIIMQEEKSDSESCSRKGWYKSGLKRTGKTKKKLIK